MKKYILLLILSITSTFCYSQTEIGEDNLENKATCGGVERWSLKVLTDTGAGNVNYVPVNSTVISLINLAAPPPNANAPRFYPFEYTTYKVQCYILAKRAETDNDYHLVLGDSANSVNTLVGEVPDPVCSEAASSTHVNEYIAARNFVNAHIAQGNVYNVTLPKVIVTGVAFIDPPHGQSGAAPNNIELHPILSIQFVNTGVENVKPILQVTVSPNPFNGSFSVNVYSLTATLKNCSIRIYNIMGQMVKEQALAVKNGKEIAETVTAAGLSSGIYIYRIINDGQLLYDGKIIAE